jgi:multiple antibiotic resistance protein
VAFLEPFSLTFTALFIALDIIGTVPIYLSLTKTFEPEERRKVVDKSMGVAFAVALVFMAVGQTLFRHIGISLNDFRIAGGLILLLISLADLLGGPNGTHDGSGSTGIVPLAVPLISGPAVLTTLLLQVGIVGYPITILALVANYALGWTILRHCDGITRWIGRDGTVVISKIAALLLAAIAVAMIRMGAFESIGEFIHTLK